jgi:hypothetical protein
VELPPAIRKKSAKEVIPPILNRTGSTAFLSMIISAASSALSRDFIYLYKPFLKMYSFTLSGTIKFIDLPVFIFCLIFVEEISISVDFLK